MSSPAIAYPFFASVNSAIRLTIKAIGVAANMKSPPRAPTGEPQPGRKIKINKKAAHGNRDIQKPTLPSVDLRDTVGSSWFIVRVPNGSELAHVALEHYLAEQQVALAVINGDLAGNEEAGIGPLFG